jgi:hypothetical protein
MVTGLTSYIGIEPLLLEEASELVQEVEMLAWTCLVE